MLCGGLDMSRAKLRVLETGTGHLQSKIEIVSGLLAVDPGMEKQKPAKPTMPSPINRARGRMGRLLGPRNLQKLGVAFREAKSVNNNLTKRGRGWPHGTGKWQILKAQLEHQSEVRKSARLVQPTQPHLLAGTCMVSEKEETMPSGAPLQRSSSAQPISLCSGSCLNFEDMSRAQLQVLETAVNPSKEKQKAAKLMPNLINRGRGRIGRLLGPRNLKKLGVAFHEAKSVNNNQLKRGRGRPRGTGNRHILRAQIVQQSEISSTRLIQPTESHSNPGSCMVTEKEEMMPGCAPLMRCSSAQPILINSPTESSAIPSICTKPLRGDNGVITNHGVNGEIPGVSQEHSRMNPQPLLGEGQCLNGANNNEWDSASLMKAIIKKHGDITKSCKFQSRIFKTNCLKGICEIVKTLQETRLADVNPGLLKELYSFIEDAESVNLEVKWLRKHVEEVEEAMSSSANELKRLEQADKKLRQQSEEIKKAIEVNRDEVAKLQTEIEVQEEELTLAILSSKDLKAQINYIKASYRSSDYVKGSLI